MYPSGLELSGDRGGMENLTHCIGRCDVEYSDFPGLSDEQNKSLIAFRNAATGGKRTNAGQSQSEMLINAMGTIELLKKKQAQQEVRNISEIEKQYREHVDALNTQYLQIKQEYEAYKVSTMHLLKLISKVPKEVLSEIENNENSL